MDVPVSAFRAELKSWLQRAADGEDVVITDRGLPVARLVAVESAELLDELEQEGLLDAPSQFRPAASVQERPSPKGTPNPVSGLMRRLRR